MKRHESPDERADPGRNRRRLILAGLVLCLAALVGVYLVTQLPGLRGRGEVRFVGAVTYSSDGKHLAWLSEGADGGSLVVWDLASRRAHRIARGRDYDPDPKVVTNFTALAFSPDGKTIATGVRSSPTTDPRLVVWDVETGRPIAVLRGPTGVVISVLFSPDGTTLASASRDGGVTLWDVATGRPRATLSAAPAPVTSIAFAPDGRSLSTGWGDRLIRIWDVEKAELATTLTGHAQGVTCLAYSPDGRALASAGTDGTLRLWDCETGLGRVAQEGLEHSCRSVVFSPDGKTLAIKYAETSVGVFWDVAAGRAAGTFADASGGLAFAPDGRTLATGGGGKGKVFLNPVPSPALADPLSKSRR